MANFSQTNFGNTKFGRANFGQVWLKVWPNQPFLVKLTRISVITPTLLPTTPSPGPPPKGRPPRTALRRIVWGVGV